MSTELYIPQQPRQKLDYNPKNGQFLKGHTPTNKGKTWDEFMSKKGQRRSKKGWKNIEKGHAFGHPGVKGAGRRSRKVIALMDNGTIRCFDFIGAAAKWIGGNRENVGRCCRDNESRKPLSRPWSKRNGKEGDKQPNTDHRYKGIRWYFESDTVWIEKYKQIKT